jgi:hypothetical protein
MFHIPSASLVASTRRSPSVQSAAVCPKFNPAASRHAAEDSLLFANKSGTGACDALRVRSTATNPSTMSQGPPLPIRPIRRLLLRVSPRRAMEPSSSCCAHHTAARWQSASSSLRTRPMFWRAPGGGNNASDGSVAHRLRDRQRGYHDSHLLLLPRPRQQPSQHSCAAARA